MNRPLATLWIALAFMLCAAPVAWLWQLESTWSRGDILALLQTSFSVLALVAAFSIAFFEHRRGAIAARQQRNAIINGARDIANRALNPVKDVSSESYAIELADEDTSAEDMFEYLFANACAELSATADAIAALAPLALPDTGLFMKLVQLQRGLEVGLNVGSPFGIGLGSAYPQRRKAFAYAKVLVDDIETALRDLR